MNLRPLLTACTATLLVLGTFVSPAAAQLELPEHPVPRKPAARAPTNPAGPAGPTGGNWAQPAAPVATDPAAATGAISSAAEFVLAEVAKLRDADHIIVKHGIRSLVALGDSGRAAGRVALARDHAPSLLLGAAVLLESSEADDRELVLARAAERMPNEACAPLANLIAEVDPVRASPRLFAQLLEHPQAAMRAAAHRHLAQHATPALLAALMPVLEARSSDARLRAVQLVSRVKDPAVMPLLLGALKDRSGKVSSSAMASLTVLEDERLDTELLRRAFSSRWILRENAYAMLTLIEREDLTLTEKIGPQYTSTLLAGLDSREPFVAGASAAALAGLGFRSTTLEDTSWLDLEVPHRLVRIVSGEDFHNDFSILRPIGLRRLTLISGQYFRDGRSWIRWWTDAAEGFRAHRAFLPAAEVDAPTITLRVVSSVGRPVLFSLAGPALEPSGAGGASEATFAPETLRLSDRQARDLYALLVELGIFTAERLPGQRGPAGAGRALTVGIAGRTKEFRFAIDLGEPWFDNLFEAASSLRERNRWQHYPTPGPEGLPEDPRAFWEAEHGWWDEHADAGERDQRLKAMVLRTLPVQRPSQRSVGVEELVRLAAAEGAPDLADFDVLDGLLRQEKFIGPRTRQLVDLLRACAQPVREEELGLELAGRMVDNLVETFGADGAVLVAELMAQAPREFVRRFSRDERPFVRAVAAATLARAATPEDAALLVDLLEDPVEEVEIAVVHALGSNQVEEARLELLLRARVAAPRVRAAALESIGELGGEGVFDALMVGLAERDHPEVVTAAARGLSVLGDPAAASILISLLSRGRESDVHRHARQGLLALGEEAWPDLLRIVHSQSHSQRREAAILLAMQGVPQAASAMMTLLTDNGEDRHLAEELAILTCVDLRGEPDPALAWWNWWEFVVHNDSIAWLRAALERLDVRPPAAEAFVDGGNEACILFLIDVLGRPETHLAERARRELSIRLGHDLGVLPSSGAEREAWIAAAREAAHNRRSPDGAR